eukprot:symbB.v1.2.010417.t1/scaffold655.1/size176010/4
MRAVLEFVSLLPGRTEAVVNSQSFSWERTCREVYLDADYSFWFFKPEEVSKWHASWRPRLEGGTRGRKARARVS